MSVATTIPTSVTGRILDQPHVSDEGDGAVAGFLLEVEQRFKPLDSARHRYRVVCAGRWTNLVHRYLKEGNPVFIAGEAVLDGCGQCAVKKPAWLLADEVIPLGRFPNPDFERAAVDQLEPAA